MSAAPLVRAVRTGAASIVANPGALIVPVSFYLMVTAVLTALWSSAAGANGGEVVGYSAVALTWYVATSEAATIPLNFRLIEDVGEDIVSGSVAVEMLRPVAVVDIRVASEFGRMLPKLAACAAVGAGFATVVAGAPPDGTALALAVPSLLMALLCNIVAQHAFAAAAFWVHEARSAWFIYQKFVFVLGGMLLPLEVLPDAVTAVARLLPFMAMAYAPSRLASGHLEPHLILVQVAWLAVLVVAARAAFAAGERRLQVVGG